MRDPQAAAKTEYVMLSRPSLPLLEGKTETLGIWKDGDDDRDVFLVRRLP